MHPTTSTMVQHVSSATRNIHRQWPTAQPYEDVCRKRGIKYTVSASRSLSDMRRCVDDYAHRQYARPTASPLIVLQDKDPLSANNIVHFLMVVCSFICTLNFHRQPKIIHCSPFKAMTSFFIFTARQPP